MKLDEYLKNIAPNWGVPYIDPKCMGAFDRVTPIKPKEYLEFAERDILGKDLRGAVNALSNSKRAIDSQLENIIKAFGLPKKRNFPERLEIIQSMGLVAPRIIRKIIQTRNLIEHEYERLSVSEAEDTVDIATLFVEATNKLFNHSYMQELYIADKSTYIELSFDENLNSINGDESPNWRYSEGLWIDFSNETKDFGITVVSGRKEVSETIVKPKDPSFLKLIRFIIEHDMDGDSFDETDSALELIRILTEDFVA